MISLEQIKLLEQKVEHALAKITELQNEKAKLAAENEDLVTEIELLKEQCERLEKDEASIEQGILNVLDKLNTVEDNLRQGQQNTIKAETHTEAIVNDTTMEQVEPTYEKTHDSFDAQPSESFSAETTTVSNDEHKGMLNSAEQSAQLDIF